MKKTFVFLSALAVSSKCFALTEEQFVGYCGNANLGITASEAKNKYPQCWYYVDAFADVFSSGNARICFTDEQKKDLLVSLVLTANVFKDTQKDYWRKLKNRAPYKRFALLAFEAVRDNGCQSPLDQPFHKVFE